MGRLRLGFEIGALVMGAWLSIASTTSEDGSGGSSPAPTPAPVDTWVPPPTCTVNTDCAGASSNLCIARTVCQSGYCTNVAPVDCSGTPNTNPCLVPSCNPSTGGCYVAAAPDGTYCASTDLCLGQGTCTAGSCKTGGATACNDGNPCTQDKCSPGQGCTYLPVPAGTSCDTGNPCYEGAKCQDGYCNGGQAKTCDDANPCTSDWCDGGAGCQHQAVGDGTQCNDGNVCTGPDICQGGACQNIVIADGSECDDANECTQGETCQGGVCLPGTPVSGSPPCDDKSLCTTASSCKSGVCQATAFLECQDDGNPCTKSACLPGEGCYQTSADPGTACPAPGPCYVDGVCSGTQCVGSTVAANGATCKIGGPCLIGSVCFNGQCQGGQVKAAGAPCDDGNACTSGDICSGGAECYGQAQTVCDDANPCTTDYCLPDSGCHFDSAQNGTYCVGPCNSPGNCQASTCQFVSSCIELGPCVDWICNGQNQCVTVGTKKDGTPCGNAPCDGTQCISGSCALGPPMSCDDGNACTQDYCQQWDGACVPEPASGYACDDGKPCTLFDTCVQSTCQGSAGCDDKDPCTADSCVANACKHTWLASASCPAEKSCTDGLDDDGNGETDCADVSCWKADPACQVVQKVPTLITFEDAAPGFGAFMDTGFTASWAVDSTPAEPVAWSGTKTLNLNDGTLVEIPLANDATLHGRLCCWQNAAAKPLFVTWMEWVDLPAQDVGGPSAVQRAFVLRLKDATWDVLNTGGDLPTLKKDSKQWRRRVATIDGAGFKAQSSKTFGIEWIVTTYDGPETAGAGWFIDDVEVLEAEDCGNGSDDNGNGKADCADPLCDQAPACKETDCQNATDDNGDGFKDCEDQDCAGTPWCP